MAGKTNKPKILFATEKWAVCWQHRLLYPDRQTALELLQKSGLPIHISGGFGDTHLPIEGYATLLQHSNITLNFSAISELDLIK